jgi:hypothetical protein
MIGGVMDAAKRPPHDATQNPLFMSFVMSSAELQ